MWAESQEAVCRQVRGSPAPFTSRGSVSLAMLIRSDLLSGSQCLCGSQMHAITLLPGWISLLVTKERKLKLVPRPALP